MAHRLPLFPLGSILFPGSRMPLRVFEERYRRLVADLLRGPAPRRFGILGIELGHEVGENSARQLREVGCVAELHGARKHSDGRYDLVVEGRARFRVDDILSPDEEHPYLRAETAPLPDELGAGAEARAERVKRLFGVYHDRLDGIGMASEPPDSFPPSPLPLSYAVSAALVIDQCDKQELLEADHAAARLDLAGALLCRENRVLAALPLLPARHFLHRDVSLN